MMLHRTRLLAVGLLALLAVLAVSCSGVTYKKYLDTADWSSGLYEGDHLRVTTVSGEQHRLAFVALTEDELIGEKMTLPLEDIRIVERASASPSYGAYYWWLALSVGVCVLGALGVSALLD